MSEAVVKKIIEKAIDDEKFREQLFTNPALALKGYDLTTKERKLFADLNEDNFDEFAGGLGDRSTKGLMPGTG